MIRRCRIALITVMLAALVPSAALAGPADCTVKGTDGDDVFYVAYIGSDAIVCGRGGNDSIYNPYQLFEGVFYGGDGDDSIFTNAGTFYGGDGDDSVSYHFPQGTFYGGDGDDSVSVNLNGTFIQGD